MPRSSFFAARFLFRPTVVLPCAPTRRPIHRPLRQSKPLTEEQASLVAEEEEEACAAGGEGNQGETAQHENGHVEHSIAPNRVT